MEIVYSNAIRSDEMHFAAVRNADFDRNIFGLTID